ncbi:MAG: [Lentisphaeria bacterium]|nr:[FeFe] hydrogenase H-cluster radical SAM maturase HydE [Lentisphaeria bacterium]
MNNLQISSIIDKAEKNHHLDCDEICTLLAIESDELLQKLFQAAYRIKLAEIGNIVSLRGLIEIGNICRKNCYYCGIRSGNHNLSRYLLTQDEILHCAELAIKFNYGSIVLQGGELNTPDFIDFIEDTLIKIKKLSDNQLGITLSLGEQTLESYQRWFAAGAHRYLLRIETSNEELYKKLHPASHSFKERLNSLDYLRRANYQVGSGVMFGFEGQSYSDMANDLLFLKKLDVDMVGMGPYSIHKDTPMGANHPPLDNDKQLKLGLKMIAVLRLIMPDINIASTTVLQALSPMGREAGLLAGANVIMPNLSDVVYRKSYQLYDNKPGIDENALESRENLEKSIHSIGEKINYGQWGDSRHFAKR